MAKVRLKGSTRTVELTAPHRGQCTSTLKIVISNQNTRERDVRVCVCVCVCVWVALLRLTHPGCVCVCVSSAAACYSPCVCVCVCVWVALLRLIHPGCVCVCLSKSHNLRGVRFGLAPTRTTLAVDDSRVFWNYLCSGRLRPGRLWLLTILKSS